MIDKLLKEIEDAKAKSTRVVGWYAHSHEVRGPFCRWFTISENASEFKKGNVAYHGDDCEYAALAMNMTPRLVKALRECIVEFKRHEHYNSKPIIDKLELILKGSE